MNKSKIALVTGGSRGLGRNMALSIAKKGLDIVITYKSNESAATEVVKEIQSLGQKAMALKLDIADVKGFEAFTTGLKKILKADFNSEGVDFLVNNGGSGFVIPSFAETTEEQFDTLVNIHFKGVFFFTQKMLSVLNDNGGIVNISSGLTRFTHPGSGAYATVKSAIETLTKYLAKELGGRNIRANTVAPGAIATDFNNGRLRDSLQFQELMKSATALNRIGYADDIGGIVAFLCTDDAKWITAQRIEASGGIYL
jgi:NAD(P)-dependent dehydrogenase (short-subunit alcohol dehydrogenase family)